MCTIAWRSSCRSIACPTLIASSTRRRSCWPERISQKTTYSHSMFGVRSDRPAEPRQKVADDGRWQNQQDGDGQGIDQEGRHAQEGCLGRVHETLCRQYRKTDSGPMNPHSRVIYSLLAVSLAAACVPL